LESELLREYRPPFNRAGVWAGPAVWITLEGGPGYFRAYLCREPAELGIGPLPSSFRHVFPALMRCFYRWLNPGVPLWEFPAGLTGLRIPPGQAWTLHVDGGPAAEALARFLADGRAEFLDSMAQGFPEGSPPSMIDLFWQEEIETLRKFSLRRQHLATPVGLAASE
jgi:hypothetical protein